MAKFLGLCPKYDNYSEFRQKRDKQREFYQRHINFHRCSGYMGLADPKGEPAATKQLLDQIMDTLGWFHPMSNNLYNEEISAVYDSHGIIGVNFEERALGKDRPNYKTKKLPRASTFAKWNGGRRPSRKLADSLLKAEPFVRNVFYIVDHAQPELHKTDTTDWNIVAIGTDLDGIINPIDICPTATGVPNFYRFLCRHLEYYADLIYGNQAILAGQRPYVLMQKLFFLNGERFIIKHL